MVKASMTFVNFKDFYKNAEYIKKQFEELSIDEKIIYKLYVYSNRLLREHVADKVWEYLNEPLGSIYYVSKQTLEDYL